MKHLATTPPMGWNSFDCYNASVTEAEVKANAAYMARNLRKHGWDHVVVDFCWSHPAPPLLSSPDLVISGDTFVPELTMDEYGRLHPAPNRFPSAANGAGFKPLGDFLHGLGLKFGLHIMRGIPRQAVAYGTPVLNASVTARAIADSSSTCAWLNHMVGVDMRQPGSQAYYDSLFQLYAAWGVDFIKADDLSFPYHQAEIEAVHTAIAHCGRPMTLSLSPGPTPLDQALHVQQYAHLWRISADFWDRWEQLRLHFELCAKWAPFSGPGCWADADMLPLGRLSVRGPQERERQTRYSPEEQITLLTLFAVFRSPLFFGGDLPSMDAATLALLTNDEVLAVNQSNLGGRRVSGDAEQAIWVTDGPGAKAKSLAVFNLSDTVRHVQVLLSDIGFATPCFVRDLWQRTDLGRMSRPLVISLPAHGAALYRLTPG